MMEDRIKRTSLARAIKNLSIQMPVLLNYHLARKVKTYKCVAFLPELIGGNWSHWIILTKTYPNLVLSHDENGYFM
eukprot:1767583-Ditylum_brightwellii.AAC.1